MNLNTQNLEGQTACLEPAPPYVTRFAPSPTGRMHAGNIFASLVSWLLAKKTDGKVILRIEDLDRDRSKQEYIDHVMHDYERLGLTWDEGPYYQNDRDDAYAQAYDKLDARGLIYPCFCTRADLQATSAPHAGQTRIYPGNCRDLTPLEQQIKMQEALDAGRLGPSFRIRMPDEASGFSDIFQGLCSYNIPDEIGDFIVRRSDGAFAYQLAVVVDDAEQGVNTVCRGIDLLDSVPRQRFLQIMLHLPLTTYAHVPILVAPDGRRLAKRNHDANIDALFDHFGTPEALLGHIAGITGITESPQAASLDEIADQFDIARCQSQWMGRISIPWSIN